MGAAVHSVPFSLTFYLLPFQGKHFFPCCTIKQTPRADALCFHAAMCTLLGWWLLLGYAFTWHMWHTAPLTPLAETPHAPLSTESSISRALTWLHAASFSLVHPHIGFNSQEFLPVGFPFMPQSKHTAFFPFPPAWIERENADFRAVSPEQQSAPTAARGHQLHIHRPHTARFTLVTTGFAAKRIT